MKRSCKIGLSINGGAEMDLETMGFLLIESPNILQPPLREYETIKYPESDIEMIDPRAIMESFDYSVKLGYNGGEGDANAAIIALFSSIFVYNDTTGLTTMLPVTLTNYYKLVQVTGYVKQYTGDTSYFDKLGDIVLFDFIVFVNDPENANFNFQPDGSSIGYWSIGSDFVVS